LTVVKPQTDNWKPATGFELFVIVVLREIKKYCILCTLCGGNLFLDFNPVNPVYYCSAALREIMTDA